MIGRRRFKQEKLLSATLLETLLVFLFILLTISSIYKKELDIFLDGGTLLRPGEIAVEEKEFEELKKLSSKYIELQKNARDEDVQLTDLLTEKGNYQKTITGKDFVIDSLQQFISRGVDPPPCVLSNGNQRLLEIDFAKDTTFLIKVINMENEELVLEDFTLTNNKLLTLRLNEFKKLGKQLHESRRINTHEPYCNPKINPKFYSSSFCYECLYVVVIKDNIPDFNKLNKRTLIDKILEKNNSVSEGETKYMTGKAHQYFSLIF